MNEAQISHKIIGHLKKNLLGPVIFKHNDRLTAGIPDISVTYRGKIHWIETKFIRADESTNQIRDHFDKLQLTSMKLLDGQGSALYFIAYILKSGLHAAIMTPMNVDDYLDSVVLDVCNLSRYAYFDGFIKTTFMELTILMKKAGK